MRQYTVNGYAQNGYYLLGGREGAVGALVQWVGQVLRAHVVVADDLHVVAYELQYLYSM